MGEKGEKVGGEPLARGCRPAPDERLRGGRSRSDGRQVADDATSKKKRREHQVVAVVARSPSEEKAVKARGLPTVRPPLYTPPPKRQLGKCGIC